MVLFFLVRIEGDVSVSNEAKLLRRDNDWLKEKSRSLPWSHRHSILFRLTSSHVVSVELSSIPCCQFERIGSKESRKYHLMARVSFSAKLVTFSIMNKPRQ
jgi:hypothetical protein